jgi:hypothetical protein
MTQVSKTLPNYQGFAVDYDESQDPFFEVTVKETLAKIKQTATGALLLTKIASSSPSFISSSVATAKVVISPPGDRKLTPRGKIVMGGQLHDHPGMYAADVRHSRPSGTGDTSHLSNDQTSASNGSGCTCTVYFTNRVGQTSKGESAPPWLMLAHELVHCLHSLEGTKKDGIEEEYFTVGLNDYAKEPITENAFRNDAGMPARTSYP